MSKVHTVTWRDSGREPLSAPNPAYPEGKDVIFTTEPGENITCKVALPYPAARIGVYQVHCSLCGMSVAVTTAGRPDDPRSVTMPCAPMFHA